jgi:hypothetical protein
MAFIPVHDMSITRPHPEAFVELPSLLEERFARYRWPIMGFSGLKRLRLECEISIG